MGGLRLSAWAAAPSPSPASAQRGFPRSPPDWRGSERGRRSHCTPSSPPVLSLGTAGRLRVGADREWLWDCRGGGLGRGGWGKDYAKEMEAAVRVVQLACTLWQRVQDSLLLADPGSGSGDVHSKLDRSPVTVADWGVQATVSWLLSDCFGGESVSIVAEEDDKTLASSDGQAWVHDFGMLSWHNSREVQVSSVSDPVSATFCEPVEKANSSHSFTAEHVGIFKLLNKICDSEQEFITNKVQLLNNLAMEKKRRCFNPLLIVLTASAVARPPALAGHGDG
ncbi:hypothetical protein ZWY2020_015376 [Hordeum vulgare]|nr:hypothetical protein ZWY2020_015376 [Hordeum vulgare]